MASVAWLIRVQSDRGRHRHGRGHGGFHLHHRPFSPRPEYEQGDLRRDSVRHDAQTILADLKDQQVGSKNLRYSSPNNPYFYKLIQVAGGVDPQKTTNNYFGIDLRVINNKQEVYLAYDAQPRSDTDPSGKPIMARPSAGKLNTVPDWYSGASPSNGLVAVAKVTFCPTFTITTLANDTGVMRVDVSVETPGNAKPENRKVRLYTGAVVP